MPWNPAQLRNRMQAFLIQAGHDFYGGAAPSWDGTGLVADIQIDFDDMTVNANLTPLGAGWGVMVSELFTQLVDDQNAQVFVLGHEYGHGMTETVMQLVNLHNLTGPAQETIADLISAYVLMRIGMAPMVLVNALQGAKEHVFNTHANMAAAGHHPVADDRIRTIFDTSELIVRHEQSFEDSCRAMLMSLGCT